MTLSDFEIEMAGRLTLFREALKIKQKEVAEGSESSQSHISAMEKGKRQIQPRVIFFLTEKYGLNVNWLYTGNGPMQIEEKRSVSLVEEPPMKYEANKLRKLEKQIEELQRWRAEFERKK